VSGAKHRRKGDRIERELVELHKVLGIHAERVPHSGAMRYRGHGADVDVYVFGRDEPPLVCEVKSRQGGAGFAVIERWLADNDVLFCRRDRCDALVIVPWRVWVHLIGRVPL
jgi:Holliday junction resolvase